MHKNTAFKRKIRCFERGCAPPTPTPSGQGSRHN